MRGIQILYGFTDDEISTMPCVVDRCEVQRPGETTKKPLESGYTATDHTTLDATHVSLSIHVSPVAIDCEPAEPAAVVEILKRVRDIRSVVTLIADTETLEELILETFNVVRDGTPENGSAATIDLELTQLTVIVADVSAPVPRHPRDIRPVNRAATPTAEEPRVSLGADLFERITGMGLIHSNGRGAR